MLHSMWQATCIECTWNSAKVGSRAQAEAAKLSHEQSSGHVSVYVHAVTHGDLTDERYAGSGMPQEA